MCVKKSQTFFSRTQRRCSQIKPKLKVEIEDGREAPLKPSFIKNPYFHLKSNKDTK